MVEFMYSTYSILLFGLPQHTESLISVCVVVARSVLYTYNHNQQ